MGVSVAIRSGEALLSVECYPAIVMTVTTLTESAVSAEIKHNDSEQMTSDAAMAFVSVPA